MRLGNSWTDLQLDRLVTRQRKVLKKSHTNYLPILWQPLRLSQSFKVPFVHVHMTSMRFYRWSDIEDIVCYDTILRVMKCYLRKVDKKECKILILWLWPIFMYQILYIKITLYLNRLAASASLALYKDVNKTPNRLQNTNLQCLGVPVVSQFIYILCLCILTECPLLNSHCAKCVKKLTIKLYTDRYRFASRRLYIYFVFPIIFKLCQISTK